MDGTTKVSKGWNYTEADAAAALAKLAKEKGKERAQLIERILRHETAHFNSRQYVSTGSAGMEDGAWGKVVKPYFPNGYEVVYFKDNHPKERGTAKPLAFIVWPSVYLFVKFFSDYIDRHNGNWARWNSTDAKRQEVYRGRIAAIKSRFSFVDLVRKTTDKVVATTKGTVKVIKDNPLTSGSAALSVLAVAAVLFF